MYVNLFNKNKQAWLYGVALALLLFLLKWLELKLIIVDHAFELYIGAIAIFFTSLGIWLALKLTKPKVKTVVVEKEFYEPSSLDFKINQQEVTRLGLSAREMDVLQLMAQGLSNREIAEQLFVSLNTVKTHTSNIFGKMVVNRRTQAIEMGKRLNLIP